MERLTKLANEREEWGSLTIQVKTYLAEADNLVTKAVNAGVPLGERLNTAATSPETLSMIIANLERISEELDILRRANRGIITDVRRSEPAMEIRFWWNWTGRI